MENEKMKNSDAFFHFVFSKKKKYALYLKDSKEKIIDVQETSVVSKVSDFVSDMFHKQKWVSFQKKVDFFSVILLEDWLKCRFINFQDPYKEKEFQNCAKRALKYQKLVTNMEKNVKILVDSDLEISDSWSQVNNSISGGLSIQDESRDRID